MRTNESPQPPSRYDTYGLSNLSLHEVAAIVGRVLQLKLEKRHSGYYGGDYYKYRRATGSELMLHANYDAARQEWIRAKYKAHELLIEVSDLPDMDRIQRRLRDAFPSIALLASSFVDEEHNGCPEKGTE